MRTKFFTAIAAFAVAFGFAACSSSDDLSVDNNSSQTGAQTNYLKVNIRDLSTVGNFGAAKKALTRADDTSASYADGTGNEGLVGNVRFYFFKADGQPFALSNSNPVGVNFLDHDFSQTSPDDPNEPTIENRTSQILVLSSQDASQIPASVVAIVNTGALTASPALGNTSKTLTELESIGQSTTYSTTGENARFLMTNSVYMSEWPKSGSEDPSVVMPQTITGSLYSTKADAENHPVDIYVERLAAKVTVSGNNVPTTETDPAANTWGLVDGKPAYLLDDQEYFTTTINSETGEITRSTAHTLHLRAVVQGWGLADATDKGYVFKQIGNYNSWWSKLGPLTSDDTNTDPRWTSADYKRSFWEETSGYNRQNPKWSELNTNFGSDAYTFPNTADYTLPIFPSPDDLNRRSNVVIPDGSTLANTRDYTKVVVTAKLQYSTDGTTWNDMNSTNSLYRFNGRYYLDEASVKNEILGLYRGMYFKDAGRTNNIDASDIAFGDPTAVGQSSDYEQKVIFSKSGTYYDASGNTISGGTAIGSNGAYITHYYDGDTYYYTTIRHIWGAEGAGSSDVVDADATKYLGFFGIVRNHWYKLTINSLAGPGTPVPDPDEPIVPVTPSESMNYLNARINVLQWRVVNQTVRIDGTTKTN